MLFPSWTRVLFPSRTPRSLCLAPAARGESKGTRWLLKPEYLGWMSWISCLVGPTCVARVSRGSRPLPGVSFAGGGYLPQKPPQNPPDLPSSVRPTLRLLLAPEQNLRRDLEEEENRSLASGFFKGTARRAAARVLAGSLAAAAECPLCQATLGGVNERGFPRPRRVTESR